jgi:two-component system, NarL family, sensor histidine kinase NreB
MNKKTSILVVDDDPAILQIYSQILRTEGYEVWEASTGQEGLQAVRERPPDLVLLDVMLPDLSGIEVCRQIKADAALMDVFVVLVSGTATSTAYKIDGLGVGADDFLLKPLDIAEFLARVRTIVRLRSTTAELRASEQRHRRLVEILPEAVGLIDLQGRFLTANPQGAEMLGYADSADLLERSIFDLTRPEDHERIRSHLRTTLETGSLRNAEYLLLRRSGDLFPAEVSAALAPNADGQRSGIVLVVRETTERKRTEKQIRLLADAVQSTQELICITDEENRFTFANRAFLQTYGYTEDEIMGRTPEFLYSVKNSTGLCDVVLQHTLRGGWKGEVLNRRKDGTEFPIALITSPIKSQEGRILGLVGAAGDITERKWVENLLRRQRDFGIFLSSTNDLKAATEQLLKVVLENEGLDCGAVYLVNPETNTLDLTAHLGLSVNFAKRSLRLAADPIPGPLASARQPISRDQVGPMVAMVQQLKRERLLALEAIPIQHSGQVVAVLNVGSHANAAISGKTRQTIEALATQAGGAIARIRAEQLLRTSRQVLEKTIHSLQAAIFIVDARTTTIEDCNPAATRMFGHSRQEMIGQSTSLLHLDYAKWEEFRRYLHATVKAQGSLSDFELTLKRKDGTAIAIEHNVVPIRSEAGEIVTWVAVIRDLTARKRIEAGLRQLSGSIIEAQELERQRVARELHDSVNQVIASAKMRLRKVGESALLNPATRERLMRCEELLLQALEENRRIAHNLRPTDLDALGLTDACRNFCREFQARTGLVMKTRLARCAQRSHSATELNLFRIVQEALNNIEKHARARTVRLQIAFQRDGLMLRIQDDGRGFDPNEVKPARRKGGGIGLTNMRERAAILGGICEVLSVANQGTTITVRVPSQIQKIADD